MTALRSRRRSGRPYVAATVLLLIAIAITYDAFARPTPFSSDYEVRAVFASAVQVGQGTPVRIAGLDVGRVTSVDAGPGNTALIAMRVDGGTRIHADATAAIHQRLFAEGNQYIAISPGAPPSPPINHGAVIPLGRTTVPVGFDQALSVFPADVRRHVRRTANALATGFGGGGGPALRTAARQLDATLASYTSVAAAIQGEAPGDLRAAIAHASGVTNDLARDPAAVPRVVRSTATVAGVLGDERVALRATLRATGALLRSLPPDLRAIDAVLPRAARLARSARPLLAAAPATLRDVDAALVQVQGLVGPRELPALLSGLSGLVQAGPQLVGRLGTTLRELTPVLACVAGPVTQALTTEIPDGALSTHQPAYLDLMHMGASLAAGSPNFDGNGTTIRLSPGEGDGTLNAAVPGLGRIAGSLPSSPTGMAPTTLGQGAEPPYRPDVPCATQDPPDYGKRRAGPPAWLTGRDAAPSRSESLPALIRLLTGLGRAAARAAARVPAVHLPAAHPHPLSNAPAPPSTPRKPAPALPKLVTTVTGAVPPVVVQTLDDLLAHLGAGRTP